MGQQFETANITYKGLEDRGLTVAVIDEQKRKWQIWKADYQDKSQDSEAYQALQNYKLGDTFGVSYQEKDTSFVGKDGKTVNFKQKTIYSILPVIAQPTATMKTSKPAPQQPTYTPNETPDWDDIAVGKCQSLFIAAFIQSGKSISEAKLEVVRARQLAELVVFGTQKSAEEEPPFND